MTHSPTPTTPATSTTPTTSVARRTSTTTGTSTGTIVDERSDNELLAAYAAGDSQAFGEFTRRHHAFVVAVAARRIGAEHWHDAQDAAAETWIAVMDKAATLGPDGVGDVKSWLASFVRNRAVRISADYSRRQTSSHDPHVLGRVISEQGHQLPGAATPTQHDRDGWEARADMLADRFARALAALPALQRDVMTYRLRERDLTARQIAAELGRTLDSVKGAERAGRQNLRRALGDLVADAADAPAEGQTAEGQTAEGQTAEGQTAEGQTAEGQTGGEQAVGEQAPADPRHGLTARRLLLVERLRENPTMGGPEAKTVLEQAGLGPLSARAARKVLTKARATLAELDHPDTPDASGQDEPNEPTGTAPKPAEVRAARLRLLTGRLRETPSMTGIAARDALCEDGLGPIAGRTTRRLLNQARANTGGTDPAS